MINFILPGMYEHYDLNIKFISMWFDSPELFYPDINIGATYGNFQFCIFDGGRIFNQYRHTCKEEMDEIVQSYNSFGVPVRLIFTNPIVPETSFKNRFGQAILKSCDNPLNEIVVNNEKFEEYLRENYPNFSFISSTTKCLNTPDLFLKELESDKYKMICLDYNLNHNHKLLQNIPQEKRNKCEFLINAICPPGCPNRKKHYKLNGLHSLSYGKPYQMSNCPIKYNTLHPEMFNHTNNLTPEEVFNYYEQGFENFKLEGRTLSIVENACNYVKYMVKPEYQFVVLYELLENQEVSLNKLLFNHTQTIYKTQT